MKNRPFVIENTCSAHLTVNKNVFKGLLYVCLYMCIHTYTHKYLIGREAQQFLPWIN